MTVGRCGSSKSSVNGPKSWSLAAELHPDISAAYDAAQDRAARQIIGWLAEHATTRVGPRGAQVAGAGRSDRGGDGAALHVPCWRSASSSASADQRAGIRGRSVAWPAHGRRPRLDSTRSTGSGTPRCTDPQFRAALGRRTDSAWTRTGEIEQLAPYVGAFSQRAAQIERNIDRYEAEWDREHPGAEPGPGVAAGMGCAGVGRRTSGQGDPEPGADVHSRWLTELADLGYRDRDKAIELTPISARSTATARST